VAIRASGFTIRELRDSALAGEEIGAKLRSGLSDHAPDALIDAADLVTEMRLVKHPYKEQGVKAQRGVEF
jgi:hypothetical protein